MLLDMDIKSLPTTTLAVDADLRARADFRGIDEAGRVHYLLGMCEALLADANREIQRLAKENDDMSERLESIESHLIELGERD